MTLVAALASIAHATVKHGDARDRRPPTDVFARATEVRTAPIAIEIAPIERAP